MLALILLPCLATMFAIQVVGVNRSWRKFSWEKKMIIAVIILTFVITAYSAAFTTSAGGLQSLYAMLGSLGSAFGIFFPWEANPGKKKKPPNT